MSGGKRSIATIDCAITDLFFSGAVHVAAPFFCRYGSEGLGCRRPSPAHREPGSSGFAFAGKILEQLGHFLFERHFPA